MLKRLKIERLKKEEKEWRGTAKGVNQDGFHVIEENITKLKEPLY